MKIIDSQNLNANFICSGLLPRAALAKAVARKLDVSISESYPIELLLTPHIGLTVRELANCACCFDFILTPTTDTAASVWIGSIWKRLIEGGRLDELIGHDIFVLIFLEHLGRCLLGYLAYTWLTAHVIYTL